MKSWLWAVEKLRDAGADINHQNFVDLFSKLQHGCTALQWAAIGGLLDCIKLLVDKGADINLQDKVTEFSKLQNLCTALYWASHNGHFQCTKFLVENGASHRVANKVFIVFSNCQDGKTAAMAAKTDEIKQYLLHLHVYGRIDRLRKPNLI